MVDVSRRNLILAGAAAMIAPSLLSRARPLHAAEVLKVRELYGRGMEFSDKAQALDGQRVQIRGFMAPPLKPDAQFFVLTKMPMAVCPFCDNEADWPRDIVLVRLRERQDWVIFNRAIVTEGVLELGTEVDEETGFVSRVRLTDAVYETA
jgi:hypothetical protein